MAAEGSGLAREINKVPCACHVDTFDLCPRVQLLMAAATVVDTVTDFIEETIENCRSNSQSGIESRLFDGTVQLATCLLAISTLISLQELSTHQESNFLDLFSTLSSVYVLFEDRLNSVAQGGSHLVSLHGGQRGRPRISIDLTQVESLLDLGLSLSDDISCNHMATTVQCKLMCHQIF